jgi:hypothetical protein
MAALVVVLSMPGCAPSMPVPASGRPSVYDRLDGSRVDASGYEAPVAFEPREVLPAALVAGDHHEVERIRNDGFTNTYELVTEFGTLEVETTGLLRKRVHETRVMAALQAEDVSADDVYLLSTANAAQGPVEGAAQILLHPVRSAKDLPTGMWSYARRLVALTQRERTYHEDHYAEELIGFSDAKRRWAYRLGVDVYSENPLLQRMLDRYAWLSLSGGLTVRAPLMAVTGPAGYALTATGTAEQMKRELRDRAPEEIRLEVRRRLQYMGVDEPLAERFVSHPWYSPTRLLAITESLSALRDAAGRETFIEAAVHADEPQETYVFVRLALMIAVYAELEAPIAELLAPNGLVLARTDGGDLVLPLYLDWAMWTAAMRAFADAAEGMLPGDGGARRMVVSGWLSPRAREQLEARGFEIVEGVEMSWLAEIDAASWRPGESDPERVLPEFGGAAPVGRRGPWALSSSSRRPAPAARRWPFAGPS